MSRRTRGRRILVAGRRESTRARIARELEQRGFSVVASCGTAAEAVEEASRTRPDLCLIDTRLAGGGVTAARAIRSVARAPRVLVLGDESRPDELLAALRAGADGFLVADVDPGGIPAELETIAAGGASLSPVLTARLIEAFRALSAVPTAQNMKEERR
jgi:DNA-binding NarL/FixJ family response regulator